MNAVESRNKTCSTQTDVSVTDLQFGEFEAELLLLEWVCWSQGFRLLEDLAEVPSPFWSMVSLMAI
jgi:hypothetical protein